ncbi:MAG: transcriptional repressor [Clostridia bacterium]|nr:transcriptional repressor [Clostridia bacterium]
MKIYHTEKREALASYMRLHAQEAFSLEELCHTLCPDGKGKSTVYRLVSRFVDEGVVRKIADVRTRHNSYQWIGEECSHHLHLKCTVCGQVIHLDHDTSHKFEDTLRTALSFMLDEEQTLLFGTCKGCVKATPRR